jgi:hypothetical protein
MNTGPPVPPTPLIGHFVAALLERWPDDAVDGWTAARQRLRSVDLPFGAIEPRQ